MKHPIVTPIAMPILEEPSESKYIHIMVIFGNYRYDNYNEKCLYVIIVLNVGKSYLLLYHHLKM